MVLLHADPTLECRVVFWADGRPNHCEPGPGGLVCRGERSPDCVRREGSDEDRVPVEQLVWIEYDPVARRFARRDTLPPPFDASRSVRSRAPRLRARAARDRARPARPPGRHEARTRMKGREASGGPSSYSTSGGRRSSPTSSSVWRRRTCTSWPVEVDEPRLLESVGGGRLETIDRYPAPPAAARRPGRVGRGARHPGHRLLRDLSGACEGSDPGSRSLRAAFRVKISPARPAAVRAALRAVPVAVLR